MTLLEKTCFASLIALFSLGALVTLCVFTVRLFYWLDRGFFCRIRGWPDVREEDMQRSGKEALITGVGCEKVARFRWGEGFSQLGKMR